MPRDERQHLPGLLTPRRHQLERAGDLLLDAARLGLGHRGTRAFSPPVVLGLLVAMPMLLAALGLMPAA